jgi:hypothetical protein
MVMRRPVRGHWPEASGGLARGRGCHCESASRPPSEFWCLNDKMIKELMSFAKCEVGKMCCNYIEDICLSRDMLWLI